MRSLGLGAHDVLSTKSPAFRSLGIDPARKSEAELIALMVQEPRLIRRPLIVVDGKVIVGFDRKALNAKFKRYRTRKLTNAIRGLRSVQQ